MLTPEEAVGAKQAIYSAVTKVWEDARNNINPEDLDRDEVWYWWPTIKETNPNLEAIADNMLCYNVNPYLCMVTVFMYGYAAALEGMANEEVFPIHQGEVTRRLPKWLEEMVLEDLAKRYKDAH